MLYGLGGMIRLLVEHGVTDQLLDRDLLLSKRAVKTAQSCTMTQGVEDPVGLGIKMGRIVRGR